MAKKKLSRTDFSSNDIYRTQIPKRPNMNAVHQRAYLPNNKKKK